MKFSDRCCTYLWDDYWRK